MNSLSKTNIYHKTPISRMGFMDAIKKVGNAIGKSAKKAQILMQRNKEIEEIKEKYLARLSQRDLERIYKETERRQTIW